LNNAVGPAGEPEGKLLLSGAQKLCRVGPGPKDVVPVTHAEECSDFKANTRSSFASQNHNDNFRALSGFQLGPANVRQLSRPQNRTRGGRAPIQKISVMAFLDFVFVELVVLFSLYLPLRTGWTHEENVLHCFKGLKHTQRASGWV
jgi:hypothetical protein